MRNKRIRFATPHRGVVQTVMAQTSRSILVLKLVRQLVLQGLRLNAYFSARHAMEEGSEVSDVLSRLQMDRFRELVRNAEEAGVPCPEEVWKLL